MSLPRSTTYVPTVAVKNTALISTEICIAGYLVGLITRFLLLDDCFVLQLFNVATEIKNRDQNSRLSTGLSRNSLEN